MHEGLSHAEGGEDSAEMVLSPKRVENLLFYSYFISQGNMGVQVKVFHWLHSNYPKYRLPPDGQDAIRSSFIELMSRMVDTSGETPLPPPVQPVREGLEYETPDRIHASLTYEAIEASVQAEVGNFYKTMNRKDETIDVAKLPGDILSGMVYKDSVYLVTRKSRPKFGRPNGQNMADPYLSHLSHLCRFVLERKSIGIPEYDVLFGQLADQLKSELRSREDKNLLDEIDRVVAAYQEKHPDSTAQAIWNELKSNKDNPS